MEHKCYYKVGNIIDYNFGFIRGLYKVTKVRNNSYDIVNLKTRCPHHFLAFRFLEDNSKLIENELVNILYG